MFSSPTGLIFTLYTYCHIKIYPLSKPQHALEPYDYNHTVNILWLQCTEVNHVTSEDPSSANRNASETEDTKLYNKVEQWLTIY